MSFRPQGAPPAKNIVFPPQTEGDVPRFIYLGELLGDANFASGSGRSLTAGEVLGWLAGIIRGEEAPRFLSRPQGIVVDGTGRILVTDFGRGSIMVFDEKGGALDEWINADKVLRFLAPVAIARGPDDQFFVTDADLAFVARLDKSGKPIATIGKGQFARPTGIAYEAATKRLFVADTHAHHIKVFDLDGRLLDVWGERGEEADRLKNKPRDEDELMLNLPTHLALANGRLYISDTMNARVQVISAATGKPLRVIGTRGTFVGNLVRPKGVAVDSEENVYVIEGYHDHLLVFNRQGRFLMPIGGEGATPGKFNLPAGLWIDGRDRVYVADTHNGRVQIFQFLGGGVESGTGD